VRTANRLTCAESDENATATQSIGLTGFSNSYLTADHWRNVPQTGLLPGTRDWDGVGWPVVVKDRYGQGPVEPNWRVLPNTHRRRDATVELSSVGVGGVYWALG